MKEVLGSILVYLSVSEGQKLKCFNIYDIASMAGMGVFCRQEGKKFSLNLWQW